MIRTQTHVLYGNNRARQEPRVIHFYGLTCTSVHRRRQAAPQFSSLGTRKHFPIFLHTSQIPEFCGL